MNTLFWLLTPTFALVAALAVGLRLRTVLVREYETGLVFRCGRFLRALDAGRYRLLRPGTEVQVVDLRQRTLATPLQEVPTRDQVAVKVSAVVQYRVVDARRTLEASTDWEAELYLAVQLALRTVVAGFDVDDVPAGRAALGAAFAEAIGGAGEALGVAIEAATVKDVQVGGDLKRALGEAAAARAEARAKLERARGESAALRSLANAARLLKDQAGLYELRLLETASEAASSANNTLVLGLKEGLGPLNPA